MCTFFQYYNIFFFILLNTILFLAVEHDFFFIQLNFSCICQLYQCSQDSFAIESGKQLVNFTECKTCAVCVCFFFSLVQREIFFSLLNSIIILYSGYMQLPIEDKYLKTLLTSIVYTKVKLMFALNMIFGSVH